MGSCAAAFKFVDVAFTEESSFALGLVIVLGYAIAFVPPIAVFVGMVWWAVATYRRNARNRAGGK
jgi:hypothetical protein